MHFICLHYYVSLMFICVQEIRIETPAVHSSLTHSSIWSRNSYTTLALLQFLLRYLLVLFSSNVSRIRVDVALCTYMTGWYYEYNIQKLSAAAVFFHRCCKTYSFRGPLKCIYRKNSAKILKPILY